jgi:hypothetical protein
MPEIPSPSWEVAFLESVRPVSWITLSRHAYNRTRRAAQVSSVTESPDQEAGQAASGSFGFPGAPLILPETVW